MADWEKSLCGSYDGEVIGGIPTSDLGFTVVGYALVDTTGGVEEVDLIIIHVDANGDSLWTRHVAGLGFDFGMDLVEISTDEYVISGVRWCGLLTGRWGPGTTRPFGAAVPMMGGKRRPVFSFLGELPPSTASP